MHDPVSVLELTIEKPKFRSSLGYRYSNPGESVSAGKVMSKSEM